MYDIIRYENNSEDFYNNLLADIVATVEFSQPDTTNHAHDFIELCYILSGKIIHTTNGSTSVLSENDFFLVDLGVPHKFTKLPESDCQLINIIFRPSAIDHTLSDQSGIIDILSSQKIGLIFNSETIPDTSQIYHDSTGDIRSIALNIKKEFAEMQFGYEQKLKCNLISLLIDIARRLNPLISSDQSGVYNIISYINQHYNEHITLEILGNKFHMNPSYLCTKLKKGTGYSFIQYLQKIRIANACRLLSLTNMRISEVCTAVGYDDIKHFEKIFRKHTTDSPIVYRKISKQLLEKNKKPKQKPIKTI